VSAPFAVVLATSNHGKAREFGRLLGEALSVDAMPDGISLPEETGDTFAANARLKAESVFSAMGGHTAVLADDSGLEVRALDGRPGVHSARFAGPQATDEANVRKLLDELGNRSDREGRFVCCLCLVLPEGVADGTVEGDGARRIEVEGVTDGTIAAAPRGNDGFGYDPVFQPQGWRLTLAEAIPEDKDRVSHRGAAARALLGALRAKGLVSCGA
jgi:XTP/dITP diphosphohydrolase